MAAAAPAVPRAPGGATSASDSATPAGTPSSASQEAAGDETSSGDAPGPAGERLASHLDMLAETVRAIVTRVMQPQAAVSPCGSELGDGDTHAATTTSPLPTTTTTTTTTTTASSGRSEYSLQVREQCVARHAAGASYKTIATELGMPLTTVQTIVKRAKQHGGVVAVAQRAGRPRATDESVEQTIREIVAQRPQLSARDVLDQVLAAHEGIVVSFETIRRRVRECRRQLSSGDAASTDGVQPVPGQSLLRTSFLQHQQQQAQLDALNGVEGDSHDQDDDGDVDMDADLYSDEPDAHADRQPTSGVGSDTEAETTSTGTEPTAASARPPAAGKARRKRGSEYSPEFREMCVRKHEREGKSYQAIATELDIPPDSVRAIVRKAKRTGSVVTAPRSGRPRKTTNLIDRVILQSVKNSQRSTAKQIQDDLWSIYQIKVSCETIRRRVRDHTKQRLQVVDSTATAVPPGHQATALAATLAAVAPVAATPTATIGPQRTLSDRIEAEPSAPSVDDSPAATTSVSTEEEASAPATTPTTSAATPTRSLKRKRSEYPLDVREKCVALHGEGLGFRKIGEQLNMPHTTVRAIVEKVLRTGSMLPAPRSGRPRKTDEILDKVILQTVKANAKCSARMIQQELETAFDVKVSCETIRRRVKDYMRQKHLFAESSPLALEVATQESHERPDQAENQEPLVAQQQEDAPPASAHGERRDQGQVHVSSSVDPQAHALAQQLELQRQQHEQRQREQQQEQHESMLLMAEITQPFHAHDAMVADVRAVPPSLMEMMSAAAAAAAAVSSHHHHHHLAPTPHLSYPPHQLPLMPVPFGFGFPNQPHAQAMQAMLDEALATQAVDAVVQHHHQHLPSPHPPLQGHHHQMPQAPPTQQQPPPSPSPMSEFVL